MTPGSRAALEAAIDAALARAMPDAIWVPGVTVLVVDAGEPDPAVVAIERVTRALDRAGIGSRRRLVLVPAREGLAADRALLERYARAAAAPALAHDPVHSPSFCPGLDAAGTALALNDELREAELVVALAPRRGGTDREDPLGVRALIYPGLAPAGGEGPRPAPGAVRALLPLDFVLVWSGRDGASWQVDAGAAEALENAGTDS